MAFMLVVFHAAHRSHAEDLRESGGRHRKASQESGTGAGEHSHQGANGQD